MSVKRQSCMFVYVYQSRIFKIVLSKIIDINSDNL